MKRPFLIIAAAALMASPVMAAGDHASGHDHAGMPAGSPGRAEDVSRSVEVVMTETDDGGMAFEPSSIDVNRGQTIRFVLVNAGQLAHEFVLDTHDGILEHKVMMEAMPDMRHDDPNTLRLEPGTSGDLIWSFSGHGALEFACLIPGHYELGMKGTLVVATP
ncbi:putative cupredoxin-like copper-binding protein [Hoeflea marina]|uniref:Putative cupredoxin-like copper-binding protein n=1 Tax=Hoeflea marina TaxID=274592 RepID=A0A317PT48_9HYPH|nr:cupredoxin family protein [Hoeflea marina]PWW01994.1 putative cupredoxin-like copper-binding protein [Hoeflea marina]